MILSAGVYGFAQHQNNFFNNVFTDCAPDCQNLPRVFGCRNRRTDRRISQRPVQGDFVADADRRHSRIAFRLRLGQRRDSAGHHRERDRPALWDRRSGPEVELGLSRLLRRILSGASASDGHRPVARFSQQPDADFRSAARRARQRTPVRRLDSVSRLGAGGRHLSNQRDQLAGPQQYRRIEYLLAAHLVLRADSRLGDHAAFAAHLASRSVPPGLFESDRTGFVAFHRRLDLPHSHSRGMRTALRDFRPWITIRETR